jgi:hypothetical protein
VRQWDEWLRGLARKRKAGFLVCTRAEVAAGLFEAVMAAKHAENAPHATMRQALPSDPVPIRPTPAGHVRVFVSFQAEDAPGE